ncbi:hypothetical protein LEHPIFIF_00166 [Aeromonas phage avDM9-HANS]|nr:hypothetical protein LEHPIFIF_00166 [Aeromonas phage avDM9-HANS]
MNYQKIYDDLIEKGKARGLDKFNLTGYFEKHHIIPRCLGGLDNEENLVLLTAREHFVVHQLLVKIHPANGKLIYACKMMCMNGKIKRGVEYGWIRDRVAKQNAINTLGIKHPPRTDEWRRLKSLSNTGRRHSDETKAKISEKLKKPKSDEMKANMSKAASNRSKKHQEKLNKALTGRYVSDEARNKMSLSKSIKVECPHCNKIGAAGPMKQWHFNNCKRKVSS